jgi:hypothetical protein
MLAIMHALTKFRQYLVGNRFKVKIKHNSLRFLMEQKELSEWQKNGSSKIQAYDFEIEYVKGKNNVVVDALSRIPTLSLSHGDFGGMEGTYIGRILQKQVFL